MRAASAIARILRCEGVELVSCFPGNPLIEACAREGIRPVVTRTERGAVNIADGFSRVAGGGRIGVCLVQEGAGIESSFAGVAQAYADSVPVLVIPGRHATSRIHVPPLFDAVEAFRPITKLAARISSPERVPELLRRAFTQLRTGRPGPVLLELPSDVAVGEIADAAVAAYRPVERHRARPDAADVERAVELLLAARRPLLLAGGGVNAAEAWDELAELAELAGLPVLTTINGKGALPEVHPLALGAAGLSATGPAEQMLRSTDLILSIGSSLTTWWMMAPLPVGCPVIQSTVDERDLAKDHAIEHALLGDARLVLADLCVALRARLDGGARPAWSDPRAEIAAAKSSWRARWAPKLTAGSRPINPYRVVADLQAVLRGERAIVTHDAGHPRDQLAPFYETSQPRGYLGWGHSTQLGYSLGVSLGVKLAQPAWKVVHVLGEAAVGMAGMELETASRAGIGIVTVVLRNGVMGGYAATMPLASELYGAHQLGGDYVGLARSLNVSAERVDDPAEVAPALRRALALADRGAPALVEVQTAEEPDLSTFW